MMTSLFRISSSRLKPLVLLLILGGGVEASERKWHTVSENYHFEDCPIYMVYAHNDAANKLSQYSIDLNHRIGSYGFVFNQRNEVTCADESPFLNELSLPGLAFEDYDFVDENATLGTARSWYIPDTGEIVECDIWYNTGELKDDTPEQNKRTTEHEVGHCLGLPHHDSKDSLMYRNSSGSPELHVIDIQLLMDKYRHCDFSATDYLTNRYTPKVLAFGRWFWTLEEVTELGYWEVIGYGESECE